MSGISGDGEEHGGRQAGTREDPFFAVVIGSGFGGAVVACRLAQAVSVENDGAGGAARRILVLERGRRYGKDDFPRLKLPDYMTEDAAQGTSKRVPEVSRLLWNNDQGLIDIRNLGELRVVQAAGYGGGSLIYANVHLRPPGDVFKNWPATCKPASGGCACAEAGAPPSLDRSGLRPYYDRVAHMLDIKPLPEADRDRYAKTKQAATVARNLLPKGAPDSRFVYPPLAVTFESPQNGRNRFDRAQGPCTGCGNCNIGCQEHAKNTLDLNYLAVAEKLGVEVRTLAEVQTISEFTVNGRSMVHVEYVDHLNPEPRTVNAEHVFICAGAVGSTELLMRHFKPVAAGLAVPEDGRKRPDVPETLGKKFFANGDSIATVFGGNLGPAKPAEGPTITTSLLYRQSDPKEESGRDDWFLMQDGGIPPSIEWALGLFKSPLWLARNRFAAPVAKPDLVGDVARLIGSFPPYWSADRKPDDPVVALARGLRGLVPKALHPLLKQMDGVDAALRLGLEGIVTRVLDQVDERLKKKFLVGWLLVRLRKSLVKDVDVNTDSVTELSAKLPSLADLLQRKRSSNYLLAAVRNLALGVHKTGDGLMYLLMGPDESGTLKYRDGHLRIEWDNPRGNLRLFTLQERLLRDAAASVGGELRTNPDWTLGRKPVTSHAQGGCAMSATPATGVTTPCGRLWKSDCIFVMDGAVLPNSVGVNPSSTIAAVAERNVELFVRNHMPAVKGEFWRHGVTEPDEERKRVIETFDRMLPEALPAPDTDRPRAAPVGLFWDEILDGYLVESDVLANQARSWVVSADRPFPEPTFRALDRLAARDGRRVVMKLTLRAESLDALLMDDSPTFDVTGTIEVAKELSPARHQVRGPLVLHLDRVAGSPARSGRWWAAPGRLTGMTYKLGAADGSVSLVGRKFVRDDPGIDVWADLSTLYVGLSVDGKNFAGILRVQLADFIRTQMAGMRANPKGDSPLDSPLDDVAQGWALARFARFFLGSVTNVYSDWV